MHMPFRFVTSALAAVLALAVGPARASEGGTPKVWTVDPLVKVFRDATPGDERTASADVARGETATFQIVVRSDSALKGVRCQVSPLRASEGEGTAGGASLGEPVVRFVGYVPVNRPIPKPRKHRLRDKLPADFPDPLLEVEQIDVKAGDAQPIWVTAKVPLDAPPGVYRGEARVSAGETSVAVPLSVKVYPARVERTRLWVTNWFQRGQGYRPMPAEYSPEFWEMLRLYARNMAEHRQTVARTVPLELAQYAFDAEGNVTGIDWSHMDRWVQIFIDEGVIGRIEGQQFGWRKDKWESPYLVSTYVPKDGKPEEVRVEPTSPEAERFYSVFLPSLERHLADKGWLDLWVQHLADEPVNANLESYRQVAALVKKHAPRLRRIDALLTEKSADSVEVMVPLTGDLHRHFDLYKGRQAAGQELWFYTCVKPQGEYANRFHENPLIQVRMLPWTNFRFGVTGFLHWGYNFWNKEPDYDKKIALVYGTGRPDALPGDPWVVYPKRDGLGVIDSIRWEAQRDGCEDHELLSQLAERDPAAADALVRRHVIAFNEYDEDVATFRATRRELLERLSGLRPADQ